VSEITREPSGAPTPDELAERVDLSELIPDNLADLAAAAGHSPGTPAVEPSSPPDPMAVRPTPAPSAESTPAPTDPSAGTPAPTDPAGSTPADTAATGTSSADKAVPTIWQQMGGPTGMLDSGLPVVVFIVANVIGGLGWGIGAAVAAAVVIAVLRIARKRPVTQAVAGLFGVGIAAFIAYKTDSAKGYFLLGIWSYLLYGGALLLSILVRWPLIGIIWEGINGKGTAWRSDKKLVRRYDWATLVWVLVFAARYLVQNYLYDTDQVGWLAAVRLLMGYPVWILAIALSVWIVVGGHPVEIIRDGMAARKKAKEQDQRT
jgi:hypothetical protein